MSVLLILQLVLIVYLTFVKHCIYNIISIRLIFFYHGFKSCYVPSPCALEINFPLALFAHVSKAAAHTVVLGQKLLLIQNLSS